MIWFVKSRIELVERLEKRFKKPKSNLDPKDRMRKLAFCWLPVRCYRYEGGDWENGWVPGRLVDLKRRKWFVWSVLSYNYYMGWISVE